MIPRPALIPELPVGYREVSYLSIRQPGTALRLNLLALVPMLLALVGMALWWAAVLVVRGENPGSMGSSLPWWAWTLGLLLLVIVLHEGLHGLGILWAGYRPRFGFKPRQGVFYATADDALFQRNPFLVIALLPLVAITLLGMLLLLIVPDSLAYYIALAVAFNAGAAIGDLWMAAAVLRRPSDALVRDEIDSIRIYTRRT